jgi:hypothetical protein
MPSNIFIFETRPVNYLKPYLQKAQALGFNVTITDNANIRDNKLFNDFIKVYKHFSVNPPEFEIACFARYFAIASLLQDNAGFLLTDTDVYITQCFKDLQDNKFHGTFIGSEGFDNRGSQEQISPHCTFWNRELLMDFIQFTLKLYQADAETNFLKGYYEQMTARFGATAVSDMNLIYLWIHANNIPYINSNSATFGIGIDHSLSTLICEDDEFISFADRKILNIGNHDRITCSLKSGKRQDMALLHFQGSYKAILDRFYAKKYLKFMYFTIKQNYRTNKRFFS